MNDEIKKEVKRLMKRVREKNLPGSQEIVRETFDRLGYPSEALTQQYVRENFNALLRQFWENTLGVLESYEDNTYRQKILDELFNLKENDFQAAEDISQKRGFKEGFKFIYNRLYPYWREIFLSISQSRKARGGKEFELQFGTLLELAGFPYQKINRESRVDFMMPSDEFYNRIPTHAVIASVKRTLRERWREVVEELFAMRCQNTYLVTADEQISQETAGKICRDYRLHLVVWDHVKSGKFAHEDLVIECTTFIEMLAAQEAFRRI